MYMSILQGTLGRLNKVCVKSENDDARFLTIIDENSLREPLLISVCQSMYGHGDPIYRLVEPPFQAESHQYHTLQAADWIAGVVGRMAAYNAKPDEYADNKIFLDRFEAKFAMVSKRSSIRKYILPARRRGEEE